jgi:hypothetical protein
VFHFPLLDLQGSRVQLRAGGPAAGKAASNRAPGLVDAQISVRYPVWRKPKYVPICLRTLICYHQGTTVASAAD